MDEGDAVNGPECGTGPVVGVSNGDRFGTSGGAVLLPLIDGW